MSTRRQLILAQIETMLEGIFVNDEQVFVHVEVGKAGPDDINNVPTPAIFVFQGPESRAEETIGFEVWNWTIILEVWARDNDLETLLGLIHTQMAKNNADGGLICSSTMGVIDVKRQSSELMIVDPTKSLEVMTIVYSIWYRHPYGTP